MTIAGVWQNEYGSRMSVALVDDCLFVGTYESSTGSTGTYRMIGYQHPVGPTQAMGQNVAFSISWHSVGEEAEDPSWHWVSGLSGQISQSQGEQRLTLLHALVASTPFPDAARAGVYIDKLHYTRTSGDLAHVKAIPPQGVVVDDPLAGNWTAQDGTTLRLVVRKDAGASFGWISGDLFRDGELFPVRGVTDIRTSPAGLGFQAVAMSILVDALTISLAGTLDIAAKRLIFSHLATAATAPDAAYLQTQISSQIFESDTVYPDAPRPQQDPIG